MTRPYVAGGAAAFAFAAALAAPTAQTSTPPDDTLVKKARAIHERVIALDTHDDINVADFTPERNYTQDLGNQVNHGGLRQRLPAGDREVRRDPSSHREDRARQDRAGAHRCRRPADQ
jgi:hypothetical protein